MFSLRASSNSGQDSIFSDFAYLKVLQSDNGTEFVNDLVRTVVKECGIDHRLVSPYHPRANGIAERFVKSSVIGLKKKMEANVIDWDFYVPSIQLAMNNKIAEATKTSPYTLMFARKMNGLMDFQHAKLRTKDRNIQLQQRINDMTEVVLPAIKERVTMLKEKQANHFNKHNIMVDYPMGGHVMLKKPFTTNKLEVPHTGPYTIIHKTKGCTYTLQDVHTNEVLPRPYPPSHLKLISHDEVQPAENTFIVEAILDHRGEPITREYLVKWEGYSARHNTWEPFSNFNGTDAIEKYWKDYYSQNKENKSEQPNVFKRQRSSKDSRKKRRRS